MESPGLKVQGYTDLEELKKLGRNVREPGLFRAYDSTSGDEVVLKLWPLHSLSEDSAIRAIWRDELRHAARFSGRRSSSSLIVPIIEALDEPDYLAVVLQPGFRLPLAWHIANTKRQLTLPQRNRATNWINLLRLAQALRILHEQGIVHRSVSTWTVYTSFDTTADFQLSGFESCFDVVSSPRRPNASSKETQVFSFRQDWIDFGLLAAELLDVSRSRDPDQVVSDLRNSALNVEERRFLRSLLKPTIVENTTGDAVVNSMEKLISRSESLSSVGRGSYRLIVSLDPNGRMGLLLREIGVIGLDATANDVKDAISTDLAPPVVASRQNDNVISLHGRHLTYTLRRMRDNWGAARCVDARVVGEESGVVARPRSELLAPVSVMSASEASRGSDSLSIDWMSTWNSSDKNPTDHNVHSVVEGMQLLLHIQALVSVANIWPVTIQNQIKQGKGDYIIEVQPREEPFDKDVRPELLLDKLADTIREKLRDQIGTSWKVTPNRLLQVQGEDADNWEFLGFDLAKRCYRFLGPGVDLVQRDWFVRPAEGGTYSQLVRHANWVAALSKHPELYTTLSDPSKTQVAELRSVDIPANEGLDESKRDALRSILNYRPLSLIQGPPGVGKTTLVNALVNHRFNENPDEKFLVVAHSHESLNHLAEKVAKTLIGKIGRRPLLVRAPERDTEIDTIEDIRLYELSSLVSEKFEESHLIDSIDESLASNLFSDTSKPSNFGPGRTPEQSANDSLILRSANVVFATCNSYSIKYLVETGVQFDWVIVEESGKASGLDLIGALLCAPRFVLIGDQEQLPPFDERVWLERLDDPKRIQKALDATEGSIPKRLLFTDDSDRELASSCLEAKRCFNLFSEMTDAARESDNDQRILSPLTHQHRMHPAISSLVSGCFYPSLEDADSIVETFSQPPPCEFVGGLKVESVGVTVVDLQWKQERSGTRGTSDPYVNSEEAACVVGLVKNLQIKRDCSVAIISPFQKQVEAIENLLSETSTNLGGSTLQVSTVDSFQGKEADVVIVSMVKNNHYTGTRAFGFLVDHRRFNVMLSRAKWKLVIVTSLSFWKAQIDWCRNHGVTHIPEFIRWLEREKENHSHVEVIGSSESKETT